MDNCILMKGLEKRRVFQVTSIVVVLRGQTLFRAGRYRISARAEEGLVQFIGQNNLFDSYYYNQMFVLDA